MVYIIGKIKLLVAIRDEVYLDTVCDYLENTSGRFETVRYSDSAALANWKRHAGHVDAFLYEPGMVGPDVPIDKSLICIEMGERDEFEAEQGRYTVRGFQRIDALAAAILRICSADKRFLGIEIQGESDTQLCLFTSPVGGAGKTTLALGTALHLAIMGRRTLYMNLEGATSLPQLLPGEGGVSLTQVMRMVIENSSKLGATLEGGCCVEPRTGLAYFSPFIDITDFDAMTTDHLRALGRKLIAAGLYDNVVLDCEWAVTKAEALMEPARNVFLVVRNTDLSAGKVNAYLSHVEQKEHPFRNRIALVVNCAGGAANAGLAVAPAASVPAYPLVVDAADFVGVATGGNPFGQGLAQVAALL